MNKSSFGIGLGIAAIGALIYFFIQSMEDSDVIVNAPVSEIESVESDEATTIILSESAPSNDEGASTTSVEVPATASDTPDTSTVAADSTTEDAPEVLIEEDTQDETASVETENVAQPPESTPSDPVEDVEEPTAEVAETNVEVQAEQPSTDLTEPEITLEADAPEFDLVRVDDTGTAVIAGTAEPNTLVTILSDGEKIGEAIASSSGEFVAIVQTPEKETGQAIELATEVNGQPVFSNESIFILPTLSSTAAENAASETAPAIVRASDEGVVIVQSAGLLLLDQISLDSISYDEGGEVILAGRGNPGNGVIVYVDGAAIKETVISESGSWKTILQDLRAGRYVLRVDEVDTDGKVNSRAESPFQRAFPQEVREAQESGQNTYIVQPGNSLWIIATGKYGEGLKYHQILSANKDQIRDPDLIYPGQVFDIPEAAE